jgi:hypothetical protein
LPVGVVEPQAYVAKAASETNRKIEIRCMMCSSKRTRAGWDSFVGALGLHVVTAPLSLRRALGQVNCNVRANGSFAVLRGRLVFRGETCDKIGAVGKRSGGRVRQEGGSWRVARNMTPAFDADRKLSVRQTGVGLRDICIETSNFA